MVVRRAKALAKVIENMTIYIKDKEIIVGNFASTPNSMALFPKQRGMVAWSQALPAPIWLML